MLVEAGVTEQQWRVLRALDEGGSMSLTEISGLACIQLPSLTRIVQTLVDKELVLRVRNSNDRRRQIISMTDEGAAVIRDNAVESRRITASIASKLGQRRHRELLDLLDKLNSLDLSSERKT